MTAIAYRTSRSVPALPELLPLDRFIPLVAHVGSFSAIVGDHYSILILEIDRLPLLRARHGDDIVDSCIRVLSRRVREVLPEDAVSTRLRDEAFALLAFGAANETEALTLATRLQDRMREPIPTPAGEVIVTASIGIAFTCPGVRPADTMKDAERALSRVRMNGGDATFVAAQVQYPQHRISAPTPEPELFTVEM